MNDATIEQEIQDKGLTAPRVTPDSIEALIVAEYSTTATNAFSGCPTRPEMDLLTISILVLKNGFTVIGKSACASHENFDADLGAKIARKDAVDQIWALEGYALRNKLAGI